MLFGSVRPLAVRPVTVKVYFALQGRNVLIKQFTAVPGTVVATALKNGGFKLVGDRRDYRFVTSISYGRYSLVGHGIETPGDEIFFLGNGLPFYLGIYAATIPANGAIIVASLVRPNGE